MKAVLVGGEEECLVAIHQRHRVGGGAERAAVARVVVVRLEVVADVHRVAVCSRGVVVGVVPLGGLYLAPRQEGARFPGWTQDYGYVLIVCPYRVILKHHPRIMYVESRVRIGGLERERPVGRRVAVYGRGEEHHRGPFERLARGIRDLAADDMLLDNRDVIVADLPFHHLDLIVGEGGESGESSEASKGRDS